MGIRKAGKIVAGTIFNNFEDFDVHATVAGDRGAFTREYLKAVGRYVFTGLGKHRITAITEQPEVIEIAKRLGGQIEGRLRNHFGPGRDGIVLGILKEEWKF
jgi:RimJ/RimL family protein N-acetyltransferase